MARRGEVSIHRADADKGFIQGILACCKALADRQPSSMPKRYMRALQNLANDDSVVVTQADKGGGVIIMDKQQYVTKMNEMLSDVEVYEQKPAAHAEKQSQMSNKEARKIFKTSEKGKKLPLTGGGPNCATDEGSTKGA